MKMYYEAPDAVLINLAAMERIAKADDPKTNGVAAASDETPGTSTGTGDKDF